MGEGMRRYNGRALQNAKQSTLVAIALTASLATACGGGGAAEEPGDLSHCDAPVSSGVDWHDCDKREANLRGVLLSGADFSGADMTGADLSGATIVKVNMAGTDLTDATLEQSLVSGGFPQGAKFCRTTMPDGTVQSSGC